MATTDMFEWALLDTDLTTQLAILPADRPQLYLEFQEPGSGSLRVPLDSAAAPLLTSGRFCQCSYRGSVRGGFFIDNVRIVEADSSEGGGRWLQVSGRGPLALLDDVIVWTDGTGATTRTFLSTTKAAVLDTLFDEAVARGALQNVTLSFTPTTSTDSASWADSDDYTLTVGQTLLDVMRDFAKTADIEFSMSLSGGGFVWNAYANGIGSDKSDTIFFRIGTNCEEVGEDERGDRIKNAILVKYRDGFTGVSDATSISNRRRREKLLNLEIAPSSSSAETFAASDLDNYKDPLESIQLRVYDGVKPNVFEDYEIGDTATVDKFGETVSYRVLGIQADFSNESYARVVVEMNDIIYENQLRAQRDLDWLLRQWATAHDGNLTEVKEWLSIGSPDGPVYALHYFDGYLYVGGDFNNITGRVAATNVARYNTANGQWEAMSTGITGEVQVIVDDGTDIYAASNNRVYRWTGAAWSILADPEGTIEAMVFFGGILYIGGAFDLGTATVYSIAFWSGGVWNGSLTHGGFTVNALVVYKGDLYAGSSGGAGALKVYAFGPWNNVMAAPTNGTNILAFAVVGDYLVYAGGAASTGRVYRWDGVSSTREDLFSVTTWGSPGGATHDALAAYLSDVYYGSVFGSVSGSSGYGNIVKYGGGSFNNLLGGMSTAIGDRINALEVVGSDVYAGGTFTTAGARTISNLAVWVTSFQSLITHLSQGAQFDLGAAIHGATAITTPTDNDEFPLWEDTTQDLRKVTWANIKATLKSFFDTLYAIASGISITDAGGYFTATDVEGALQELGAGGGGGGGFGVNEFHIDQSGGTSDTFGVLSGTLDGSNTDFTVSTAEYNSGSLSVYLNGQLLTQGSAEDWIELTPASGTFRFNTAPEATDEITVVYQVVNTSAGNADTVDGFHATAFATSGHTHPNITDEEIQDIVGAMVSGNVETGINVTYDDANGKIDLHVVGGTFNTPRFIEQGSDPLNPAAGERLLYAKNDGMYEQSAGGDITGPLIGVSGWTEAPETWTRTGNHTFTVSGDRTSKFRKGTKIRYNDGAVDYGVVGSSSHAAGTTTVDLIPNTSYAMAATTIIAKYVSYIENPEGFPGAFNFSSLLSSSSGSLGTYQIPVAYWVPLANNSIQVVTVHTITNLGTASGVMRASGPINAARYAAGLGRENAVTGVQTNTVIDGGSNLIQQRRYDNGSLAVVNYQLAQSTIYTY